MDALIIILFVAVVAAIVIKRKKPELWSTIIDKVKVWK